LGCCATEKQNARLGTTLADTNKAQEESEE
jgi:hypothetical protein